METNIGAKSLRPSKDALLNPRCDAIFKTLFTDNSANGRLALRSFLEAVLGARVSGIQLRPNETAVESEYDKQAVFDIACTLNGTEAVNIEMQGFDMSASYGKRAEYYAAQLLNHYTPKGARRQDIPRVFQISVLNFVYDGTSRESLSVYNMRTADGRRLSDRITVILIELPKVSENVGDDIEHLTAAEKWGKFLVYADRKDKREFVRKLCESEEGIMAANTILSEISQDELNWLRETSREKWHMDYISGISEAEERGEEKVRAELQPIIDRQTEQMAMLVERQTEQVAMLVEQIRELERRLEAAEGKP